MKPGNLLLHVLLPLLVGLCIYIVLRPANTFLHKITGIDGPLYQWENGPIKNFVYYYLPDMCWAYAMAASLRLSTSLPKWSSAAVCIVALSFYEIAQADFQVNRIDFADCGLMSLATVIASIVVRK